MSHPSAPPALLHLARPSHSDPSIELTIRKTRMRDALNPLAPARPLVSTMWGSGVGNRVEEMSVNGARSKRRRRSKSDRSSIVRLCRVRVTATDGLSTFWESDPIVARTSESKTYGGAIRAYQQDSPPCFNKMNSQEIEVIEHRDRG